MSIEEFYEFKEMLSKELSEFHGIAISDRDVVTALFLICADQEDIEWIGHVEDLDLVYDPTLAMLREFDFEALSQQIEIPNDVIPDEFVSHKKVRVKVNGSIWIIHKNDADPFPSNPHAHNAEFNQKLDLSNGNCYKKRQFLFKIPEKPFLRIRKRAEEVFKGTLPELAI